MTAMPYIASDLSGLLIKHINQHALDAPAIKQRLAGHKANNSSRLGYEQWCAYISQLSKLSDNPSIGIDIGEQMELSFCGVLGHLALSCGTVAEAFARFARYQRLLYEGAGDVTVTGNAYRITWGRAPEVAFETYQSDEILVIGLLLLSKLLSGKENLTPLAVGFMHPEPSYASKYTRILGSTITYNQPQLYVELSVDFLNQRINSQNPELNALFAQQANVLLTALPRQDAFDNNLRHAVIQCIHKGTPSLEHVSNTLNISTRTLHRRLEKRSLNFGGLLQKIRQELAMQYLNERQLSIIEISLLLGYSEQSAFARAFKQWTGKTPRNFQQRP